MKIYKNFCVLSISFISFTCLAMPDKNNVDIKVRTEPQIEPFLGKKIDFSNGELFEDEVLYNIDLEGIKRRIVLNRDKMDVTFYTDPKDNFNKIKANIGFDLYVNDVKKKGEYNLNLHCPVTQDTYIEHQALFDEKVKDGQKISTYNLAFEVLERKVVDQGFYSFSFRPKDVRPLKIEEDDVEKELLRMEKEPSDAALLRKHIRDICLFIDLDLHKLVPDRSIRIETTPLK